MALLFIIRPLDICNIFAIPIAGSEPVISFSIRANPFHRVCLFCNFVTSTIYVLNETRFQVVLMARNHNI
jgi:hypothetical protein